MSLPSSLRIAVVDDDASQCRSWERLLRASGLDSSAYLSAEAFLADPQHTLFDCLILDVHFEGMSGLELQRRLGDEESKTPIIFITAQDDLRVREAAEGAACCGFFRKTESGTVVLAAIRRAVEQSQKKANDFKPNE